MTGYYALVRVAEAGWSGSVLPRRAQLIKAECCSNHDGDGEPEDERDGTDADHDQCLNGGRGLDAGDSTHVHHKAQRSDQSTEGATDSDHQEDRQQGHDSQDSRYRGPGPMPYTVDLHSRVGVGERAAYSGFNRTTARCRQRVLVPAGPGGWHSANGDDRVGPEGVGRHDNRAGYAVDADRFCIHQDDLKLSACPHHTCP